MDSLRFKAIQDRIAQLPPGGISYKTIHGKRYACYQWTENGKQYGRRVKDEELAKLTEQIEERRRLQRLLKEEGVSAPAEEPFFAVIKKGAELLEFAAPVRSFLKRECYTSLHEYIYGNSTDRVLILYGLRRTARILWDLFFRKMKSCMTAALCCIPHLFFIGNSRMFWVLRVLIGISVMAGP